MPPRKFIQDSSLSLPTSPDAMPTLKLGRCAKLLSWQARKNLQDLVPFDRRELQHGLTGVKQKCLTTFLDTMIPFDQLVS